MGKGLPHLVSTLVARYWRRSFVQSLQTAGVACAMFVLIALFILFDSRLNSLASEGDDTSVFVMSEASAFAQLPIAHAERIAGVSGVDTVEYATRFGAVVDGGERSIPSFSVSEGYLPLAQDSEISAASYQQWRECRNCVLVGTATLQQQGWRVGQSIQIQSDTWRNESGATAWDFQIAGVFRSSDGAPAPGLYSHYDYLDAGRTVGQNTVGVYLVGADAKAAPSDLAVAIDRAFDTDVDPTNSFPKSYAAEMFVGRLDGTRGIIEVTAAILVISLAMIACNAVYLFLSTNKLDIHNMRLNGFDKPTLVAIFFARNMTVTVLGFIAAIPLALLVDWYFFGSIEGNVIQAVSLKLFPMALLACVLVSLVPTLIAMAGVKDRTIFGGQTS